MISAVVFSRDRPAQLDLLLRSIERHVNHLKVNVLYKSTSPEFTKGYMTCQTNFPKVTFIEERNFKVQLEGIVAGGNPFVLPLCDDDVFYHDVPLFPSAGGVLKTESVLCFSLRLGSNTTYCYPMHRPQRVPMAESLNVLTWKWGDGEYDFGYPGSLDGHCFRAAQFVQLVKDNHYQNPNQLEDVLNRNCQRSLLPLMCSYHESKLVGLPVNRVTETHQGNRLQQGETVEQINLRYLQGERIRLDTIEADKVNAAHVPFLLRWESRE